MLLKDCLKYLFSTKVQFLTVSICLAVSSDFLTHQNKGKTVMTDDERYEGVRHCRYVDEVVKDAPWIIDDEFLEENKVSYA